MEIEEPLKSLDWKKKFSTTQHDFEISSGKKFVTSTLSRIKDLQKHKQALLQGLRQKVTETKKKFFDKLMVFPNDKNKWTCN